MRGATGAKDANAKETSSGGGGFLPVCSRGPFRKPSFCGPFVATGFLVARLWPQVFLVVRLWPQVSLEAARIFVWPVCGHKKQNSKKGRGLPGGRFAGWAPASRGAARLGARARGAAGEHAHRSATRAAGGNYKNYFGLVPITN